MRAALFRPAAGGLTREYQRQEEKIMQYVFPKDFIWGAATAAYQIEERTGGRQGENIWDRYSHIPEGPSKAIPGCRCDHYHRYEEDIRIMKEIGLKSYRFSISWARIFHDGKGTRTKRDWILQEAHGKTE